MMESYQKPLNVRSRAHLLGRSQQDSNSPGDHSVEEELLRNVRLGVMDERDLRSRHSGLHELGADILIYVEPFRVRRREMAEDELSAAFLLAGPPDADDAGYGAINLPLDLYRGGLLNQAGHCTVIRGPSWVWIPLTTACKGCSKVDPIVKTKFGPQ
jgi:hypothetical protein